MSTYTINLPDEIDQRLAEIARGQKISKAEVMQKAFALLALAVEEKKAGNSLGILQEQENHAPKVVKRVVGL